MSLPIVHLPSLQGRSRANAAHALLTLQVRARSNAEAAQVLAEVIRRAHPANNQTEQPPGV